MSTNRLVGALFLLFGGALCFLGWLGILFGCFLMVVGGVLFAGSFKPA